MSKRAVFYNSFAFVIKCAFASGLIMFICMATGELLVNPQLFHGFLNKPKIWPFIFLESATWMIPMALLNLPLLWKLRKINTTLAASVIILSWAIIGIAAIVSYKTIYYPEGWNLNQVTSANITFGWTIPCAIILIINGILSTQLLKLIHRESENK